MMPRTLVLVVVLLITMAANMAHAGLHVVATTSSMGMLARTVGGDAVSVAVLAPPDRDAHDLQARPSMIRDLRAADLLVAVGAELEVGWLPVAIDSSANPAIRPGQAGYFEAAAQVALIDAGQPADRAMGDVHPAGNPHLNLDPVRMARVAEALATRLGQLAPARTAGFRARAQAFRAAVEARLPRWQAGTEGAPGVVSYHRDLDYLLERLDVASLGFIEPVPGVPPSASHLRELISRLKGHEGVVIYHGFDPPRGPRLVGERLGWPRAELPLEPALDAGPEAYLDLIERYVEAIASAR